MNTQKTLRKASGDLMVSAQVLNLCLQMSESDSEVSRIGDTELMAQGGGYQEETLTFGREAIGAETLVMVVNGR